MSKWLDKHGWLCGAVGAGFAMGAGDWLAALWALIAAGAMFLCGQWRDMYLDLRSKR